MFFATVARFGVFCVGHEPVFSASVPRCFLRRPRVFIALVTGVFCDGGVFCGVFCDGYRGILRQLQGGRTSTSTSTSTSTGTSTSTSTSTTTTATTTTTITTTATTTITTTTSSSSSS